jgi:hypothetical protein
MKSSLHSLIPFLSLFCTCKLRRLDSVQFLCSQAHITAGCRLETWLNHTLLLSVKVKVTLRLTVSQSVSLGVRYLLLFDSCGLMFVGRPIWRENGSVFCICCWPLPAQSFSGPSPLGLAAIFYCLRFETSLFVASYDSQGHGGGWAVDMGILWLLSASELFFITSLHDHTENTAYCWEGVFTESLHSNGSY